MREREAQKEEMKRSERKRGIEGRAKRNERKGGTEGHTEEVQRGMNE